MYSYQGLNKILNKRGMKKTELTKCLGISSRTLAKIGKGEKIADNVLNKLCGFFGCTQNDLVRKVCDNPVLQVLRDEKEARLSGGLYHETQVRLTYNSSRIEGSKLSEDQTRLIFETNTISATDEGVLVDDIIETSNHFRAVDYVIDHAEEKLSENFIKELHKILKTGTKDSYVSWFKVGDYKAKANTVGGKTTTLPKQVSEAMKKLLTEYNSSNTSFEDIVAFHYEFESIHPFQDGNGRVGRLIAFKECLCHNIVPFIIEDRKKAFYYRGLKEWNNEKGFLIGTCLDGQDTYKALLNYFEIEYKN
jgi:Fic family protein/DNA-binding Xre family transcriptional regulator